MNAAASALTYEASSGLLPSAGERRRVSSTLALHTPKPNNVRSKQHQQHLFLSMHHIDSDRAYGVGAPRYEVGKESILLTILLRLVIGMVLSSSPVCELRPCVTRCYNSRFADSALLV